MTSLPKWLLLASLLLVTSGARAEEIIVSAAASLTDALKEIGRAYQSRSRHKILLTLGPSSFLARQIEEGAPADLFFSADEAKMDVLERKGLLAPNSRHSRLSNLLVIVTASDSAFVPQSPKDLTSPQIKRLALGDIKTVPAGTYAFEFPTKIGIWP